MCSSRIVCVRVRVNVACEGREGSRDELGEKNRYLEKEN